MLIIFVWSGLDALDSAAIGRWAELHFDPLIKGDQFLLKGNQTTRCDDGVCVADRDSRTEDTGALERRSAVFGRELFNKMDKDGNGAIDETEFLEAIKENPHMAESHVSADRCALPHGHRALVGWLAYP